MTEPPDHLPPGTLVAEYKHSNLIFSGIIFLGIGIFLLANLGRVFNIVVIIALILCFWYVFLEIRKLFTKTVLIITSNGILFNNKENKDWNDIQEFYIKTITDDESTFEQLIIETKTKKYKFIVGELVVDREKLNRWITYFNKAKKS